MIRTTDGPTNSVLIPHPTPSALTFLKNRDTASRNGQMRDAILCLQALRAPGEPDPPPNLSFAIRNHNQSGKNEENGRNLEILDGLPSLTGM